MTPRYWYCRIDGILWLMYGPYRLGVQAESWEQLEAFLTKKGC